MPLAVLKVQTSYFACIKQDATKNQVLRFAILGIRTNDSFISFLVFTSSTEFLQNTITVKR